MGKTLILAALLSGCAFAGRRLPARKEANKGKQAKPREHERYCTCDTCAAAERRFQPIKEYFHPEAAKEAKRREDVKKQLQADADKLPHLPKRPKQRGILGGFKRLFKAYASPITGKNGMIAQMRGAYRCDERARRAARKQEEI